MYGSNITDSYGTISPNRNHTNETINAFRISFSGDIDGRNWIFTTGSYGIWQKYTSKFFQNYWWLRSPYTYVDNLAWDVTSSGVVSGDFNGNVYFSYGRESPNMGTSYDSSMWHVRSDGGVYDDHVINSYGFIRINLSIITEK